MKKIPFFCQPYLCPFLFNMVCLILINTFSFISSHAQSNTAQVNSSTVFGVDINTYNGNMLYRRTDLSLPSIGDNITFTFTYNSRCKRKNFGMGKGWTMSYNMFYTIDGSGNFKLEYPDGQTKTFSINSSNFDPPPGTFETVENYASDKYVLIKRNLTRYYFDDSSHKKLTRIEDLNGNTTNFIYDASDKLINITSSCGTNVSLTWVGGYLTQIEDSSGTPTRVFQYQYANGFLTQYTDPMNNAEQYTYNNRALLRSIVNKNNDTVELAYDYTESVNSLLTPLSTQTFFYNMALYSTTVAEQVGNTVQTITYLYNDTGQLIRRTGDCCGNSRDYAYDTNNNIITQTDYQGNTEEFSYNALGQVLSRADYSGNSRSYIYNSANNRVASETDENGNTTTYLYDGQGNLTQVNFPLSITESYSYNLDGTMASHIDKNGNTTIYEYDACGQQTAVHRPLNNSTLYTYNGRRLLEEETDPNGCVTTYTYNLLNQQESMSDDLGNTTTYAYDPMGNQTSMTDPNGNITTYTYDLLNRLIATNQPEGITTSSSYDRKNLVSSTDANGNTATYIYNSQNRVEEETDAAGNSMAYTYDAKGNRLTSTDANENTTIYVYDILDRLERMIDPLGGETIYTYDPNGNQLTVRNANNEVTSHEYDALNRLIKITDPLGGEINYTYDNNGNRVGVTDPNGNMTNYTYDALNRMIQMADPLGNNTTYMYDANGNVETITDAANSVNQNTYDCNNRLLTNTNAEGEITSYTYDANGNQTQIISANGNVLTQSYDGVNRLINIQDNLGLIASYIYDNNGNVLSQTDGNNNTISILYDVLNRAVQQTDALGESSTIVYDNNSNLLSQTDREGNVTSFEYDALNRRTRVTDALNNQTSYSYDALGNLTGITDANGNTTLYAYDGNNKNTQETFADGNSKIYTYDLAGNMLSRIKNNGDVMLYSYDANHRLTVINYPDNNDDNFVYDNLNRVVSTTNANAIINYTYDQIGRPLSEELNGHMTAYTYDVPNNIKTIAYPNSRLIEENFDLRNRLTLIKEAAANLVNFSYDAGNRITQKTYANGVVTTLAYDTNNRMTSLTHNNGSNFIDLAYGHDKEGNKLYADFRHKPDHSEQYEYDGIYQLTNYKKGTLATDNIPNPQTFSMYNLDALGNRTTVDNDGAITNYMANEVNEYTQVANNETVNPVHDDNGNLIYDGQFYYGYDYNNRMTVVALDANLTLLKANYKYDSQGRRVQKIANGIITNFYYSGARVIMEETENPNCPYWLTLYTPENGTVKLYTADNAIESDAEIKAFSNIVYTARDSIMLRPEFEVEFGSEFHAYINGCDAAQDTPEVSTYVYGTWIDDVLSKTKNTTTFYYHQNALGSVVALTDDTGGVAERYDYDAFGKVVFYDENFVARSESTYKNDYLFTGRRLDAETGLYYYRARHYHATLGRFMQRDPLGYVDGMNLYGYVGGNVVNFLDPLGLNQENPNEGFCKDLSKIAFEELADKIKDIMETNIDNISVKKVEVIKITKKKIKLKIILKSGKTKKAIYLLKSGEIKIIKLFWVDTKIRFSKNEKYIKAFHGIKSGLTVFKLADALKTFKNIKDPKTSIDILEKYRAMINAGHKGDIDAFFKAKEFAGAFRDLLNNPLVAGIDEGFLKASLRFGFWAEEKLLGLNEEQVGRINKSIDDEIEKLRAMLPR